MFTLNCNGRLRFVDHPLVMGIINLTPDSFYAGSRLQSTDDVCRHVEQMLAEGVDIIDVGGQSTRPGSTPVEIDAELTRVIPTIETLARRFPDLWISIDTFFARVAKDAVQAGASLVNDVSAASIDETMLDTVASLRVPYVLMHMKGRPADMQHQPAYDHVVTEVLDFFVAGTERCRKAGIHDIILDPGFGFGKTIAHNFTLLNHLEVFSLLGYPLLAGISRKSTIYKTLGTSPESALNGTTVLNTVAVLKGASMLRVHDVREARETVLLVSKLMPERS